ncbi:MAG TPA: PAS domain S-box protein [Pyrinomonadaceae bacterium]|jgi:PAS domain S-box-containing protein
MPDPRPHGAQSPNRHWSEAAPARYALAVAAAAAATLLMFALYAASGIERGSVPFVFYFVAVIVVALYAGRGPALLNVALSALAANFFFLGPPNAFALDFSDVLQTGVFVAVSLFISALADRSARAQSGARADRGSLQTTLRSIGDAVISTDAAGRVRFMNPVAERLTGWTLAEAEGRPLGEVFRIVNEVTRESVESPVDKVLREGKVVGLANHTVLIARGGGEVPIEDSGAPIRDERGRTSGVVLVFHDVTEQRKVERVRALQAAIVESSSEAVIGKTLEGTVTSWNAAAERMYGYTAEEAVGRHISFIVPEELRADLTEILSRLARGERVERAETVRVRKDGSRLDVSLIVSPIRDESGAVVGASTVARDITAQKRGDEERARLALLVAHERGRLKNLVANVPGIVWEAWGEPDEGSQRIDFVSEHVEQMLGYTVEEWLATPNFWLSIVHPEDRDRAAAEARAIFESGRGGTSQFRWVARDGRVVHVESQSRVILDERGEPAGMRGVTMDITERKRGEAVTQFLLEINEALASAATAGDVMRATAGPVGEFFGVAHCAFVEFDREAETAVIHYDWRRDADAVGYAGTYAMSEYATGELRRTLISGAPVVVNDVATDPRTSQAVENYRRLGIGSFLNTPHVRGGELKFALGVYREEPYGWREDEMRLLRELTARIWTSVERRRAEEALAENRRLLETVADNATLALFIMDERQQCVFMNPAAEELTGFAFAEVRGRPLHYYLHHTRPDGTPYPLEECPIDQALPQNMRERGEEVFVHKDGHFYPVAFTASPVREGGRPVGTIIEVRDIREEQRAEREREQVIERERALRAQAEQVNRAKDEFLATLSHELRTPLTPILGWTHMIRSGRLGDAEVAQGVRVIEKNSQSLARLINDLLDMSSILSGKMRIERAPVELGAVVREAAETVRPQADARSVSVEVQTGGLAPAVVSGDRTRLVQVFWNLLHNAVKFSPEGGRVRVRVGALDGTARVEVEDEGAGIPPEFLPHVFERFRQADMATTRAHGGLGLGLALVKSFVEAHGGSVSAESAGEGRGSRFTVALPSVESDGARRGSGDLSPGAAGPCAGESCRVLLVEDAPDTLEMLRVVFESRGYTAAACATPEEALSVAESGRFDIIVSDIGLPRIDGYELIARLRELPHLREVPALALTGYAARRDAEAALAAGFDAHVPKPVDPAELAQRMDQLTRRGPGNEGQER